MERLRSERKVAWSYGTGLGVFAGCQAVGVWFPAVKLEVFCRAASWLAAGFLAAPRVETESGFLLDHPRIAVHVVEACSGYDFFSLLYAVLCAIAVRYAARVGLQLFILLPVAVGLTLAANTARIVCAVDARVLCAWLPAGPSAEAMHLAVGVFVFVTILAASCHATRILYAKS